VVKTTNLTPALPITAITGVSVGSAKKHTLTLQNGTFTAGATDETQSISFPTIPGGGATTITSDYSYVYPSAASPTEVKIGSITIDGTLYNKTALDHPLVAKVNTTLAAGGSYTLTVDFKELYFAGSNIYWDKVGGRLTFDGPDAGESSQWKQGIFFKWGSLVGISPALRNGSIYYNINTPVYIPEYNSGSPYWSQNNSYSDMSLIPYELLTSGGSLNHDDNYLSTDAHNTANNHAYWNAKKGDICRYISENGYGPGGNWRMPTANELGAPWTQVAWSYTNPKPAAALGWERLGGATWPELTSSMTGADDKYGTNNTTITTGAKFYNAIFPASGHIFSEVDLMSIGQAGTYWTSGQGNSNNSFYLLFVESQILMHETASIDSFPIRCVKN
jgi:hypothetical protein